MERQNNKECGLTGESVVYFGPEPWEGLWRNRHQLMSRFARENLVLYVEPPVMSISKAFRLLMSSDSAWALLRRRRISHVSDRLYVLHSPIWLPFLGKAPFDHLRYVFWRRILRNSLRKLGMDMPIVWFSRPSMVRDIGAVVEKLSIYHVVDEYAGYGNLSESGRRQRMQHETEMLQRTDLAIVVSRGLLERKRCAGGRVYLVPNAADYNAYRPTGQAVPESLPPDLRDIPNPLIGYSGLVAGRLDLELLYGIATRRPDWSFVLLGAVRRRDCEAELDKLEKLSNIHFLGYKPVQDVPDYVLAFQVCIVPYKLDERAEFASPLKIYEYAAAEKPIVATSFQAAKENSEFVMVAKDAHEFEQLLAEAIDISPTDGRIRMGSEVAKENTWDRRVEMISRIIRDELKLPG